MLKYKYAVLIILLCSMAVISLGWMLSFLTVWIMLVLILVNIGLLAGGAFVICSGLYVKVYCRSETAEQEISLTFDDGPHPEFTPGVLDILKKHKIKAGFFVNGKNINGNESLLKRMLEEGHIIGNHSYNHSNVFGFLSTEAIKQDLIKNEALILDLTGEKCAFFRPPFGITNPHIAKAVRSLDYKVIGWNIRSFDTINKRPEKTIRRISRLLKPGSVILLHDNRKNIEIILEELIDIASGKEYKFVAPDKLLRLKAYK